ncbi:uncharacterized protein LOC106080354 [Biomphalaria glabrata]|uniref:Uncharacterized protein LOC106080354 n=1 Tax=Biomphalaria glabrata TaxID=6526 RepID=A0A9U8EPE9_BIOGL|nr:uncharacterized protein LOC106080354 [Biomphalaria glabrata]
MGIQSFSVNVLFNVIIFTYYINLILQYFILFNTKFEDQSLFNANFKHNYNFNGSLYKCLNDLKMDKDEQLLKAALEKQLICQHYSGCSGALRKETIFDKKSTHLYLPYFPYLHPNQMTWTVYPVFYPNRLATYRLATYRLATYHSLLDSVYFSTLSLHGFGYSGHDRVTCSGCNSSVELSDFNSKPSNARYHRNSGCIFIEQEDNDNNSYRYSQASIEDDVSTYDQQRPGIYEVTPVSVNSEENASNSFKKEVTARHADSEGRHHGTHSSEQVAASNHIHLASDTEARAATLNTLPEHWHTHGMVGATSSNNCLTLRECEGYDVADSSQNEGNVTRRGTYYESSDPQCLNNINQRRNLNLRANRVVNYSNEVTTNLEHQMDILAERNNYRLYNYSLASERERSFTDLGITRVRRLAPEWAEKGLFCAGKKERTVHCYYCRWSRCWDNCNSEVMQRLTDHSCHCDVPALSTTKKHKDVIKHKKT